MDKSWRIQIATKEDWGVAGYLFNKVEDKFRSICDTNGIVRFIYRQECVDLEVVPETFKNLVVCDEFNKRFTNPIDALIAFKNDFPSCVSVLRHVDRNTIRLQPYSHPISGTAKEIQIGKTENDTEYYFCDCSSEEMTKALGKLP